MKYCVVGSLKVKGDNDDSLVLCSFGNFRDCLLKPTQQSGRKNTGKCVEGERKSTMESTMKILIPSRSNGMAGDLLECNCHCYLCDANDREMMGPGGQRLQGTKLSQLPDN
jgi:hypothetical protein